MALSAGRGGRDVVGRFGHVGRERNRRIVALAAIATGGMRCRGAGHDGDVKKSLASLMAAGTRNTTHGCVVHGRAGPGREIRGRMARFAGGRVDWNVRRRHSRRAHAVVTSRAIAGDALVFEAGARPADR